MCFVGNLWLDEPGNVFEYIIKSNSSNSTSFLSQDEDFIERKSFRHFIKGLRNISEMIFLRMRTIDIN